MMKEHDSVYLAWQAPDTRSWHVVGQLAELQNKFTFNYTNGALASKKFIPFSGMKDLYKTYVSEELFPLFKNRILSEKRPEYPQFIKWLGFNKSRPSPVSLLGRSGGLRGTDRLQMFKKVEIKFDGKFSHVFFVHGVGYLPESAKERVTILEKGEKLALCLDSQNEFDKNAVIIRAERPAEIIGYCPSYLAKDISALLKNDAYSIQLYVEHLSENAPDHYKLMCKLSGKVSNKFADELMNREEYKIIEESRSNLSYC